ncbi:MAG: methyltransferase [Bacteroidales bacterium]|nr:methyltransferase [Bacteroidales bacterium]MDD3200460.1 methyltransferase [Bacteroidales bacterium]
MGEFKFKRFSINNQHSAMKVNTDGVLLGAWVSLSSEDTLLMDIGTGTGVMALIVAQRLSDLSEHPFRIEAIDIDEASVCEAADNFASSPWKESLRAENCRLQSYRRQCKEFDLLFCNPPYFKDSLKAPSLRRSNARHEESLPGPDIIVGAKELLSPHGRLSLILPPVEGDGFITITKGNGLYLNRICKVKSRPGLEVKRYMMEFSFRQTDLMEESLTIQEESDYTAEYKSLTKDFYLNF